MKFKNYRNKHIGFVSVYIGLCIAYFFSTPIPVLISWICLIIGAILIYKSEEKDEHAVQLLSKATNITFYILTAMLAIAFILGLYISWGPMRCELYGILAVTAFAIRSTIYIALDCYEKICGEEE